MWPFCSHSNLSFPITPKPGTKKPEAAAYTGCYVTCLDCGREFAYDWKAMKVMKRIPKNYTLIPKREESA